MGFIIWRSCVNSEVFKPVKNNDLETITKLIGYLNHQAEENKINFIYRFSTRPEGEKVKLQTILEILGYQVCTPFAGGFVNFFHPKSGDRIMIGKEMYDHCN